MDKKKIVLRKTEELAKQTAEYNPRRITDDERAKLRASIQTFGFIVPVIINKTTGRVISGHQRIAAAIELGQAQLPTIELEITEGQEKLLNVALNRIKGRFDAEKLDLIFAELTKSNANLDHTGFDALDRELVKSVLGAGKDKEARYQQVQFHVEKRYVHKVKEAIRASRARGPFKEYEQENVNGNGNALTRIAESINAKSATIQPEQATS